MTGGDDLHTKKRKKNYAVLACIAGFIVIIWAITMIKMGMQ